MMPRVSVIASAAAPSGAARGPHCPSNSLSKCQVVVWDVDGTLADSTDLGFDCTNLVLRQNALAEITRAQYLQGTRHTTPRRLAWHATGDADAACGEALGAAFDATYVELVSRDTTGFYDGVDAIVERLREDGRAQAVLSNACGTYARAVVRANGVEGTMKRCYGADDVPLAKPAPDGVLMIMRELGVEDLGTVCYIGDAPSDGAAARAAGCVAVGVNWGSHDLRDAAHAENFDVVFDTVDELAAALFDDVRVV